MNITFTVNVIIVRLFSLLISFLCAFFCYGHGEIKSETSSEKKRVTASETNIKSERKVIDIFALDVPGLHNKDGQGAYDVILKKVIADDFIVNIKALPPKRAILYFGLCNYCCFSPANTNANFYDFPSQVRETSAMTVAKIFIFSPYGTKPFKRLSELAGKEVGVRRGMPMSKNIISAIKNKNFNVQKVKTLEANFLRLEFGRVAAVLGWFPDAELFFEKSNIKPLPYDKNYPVAVHKDAFVCKGLPELFYQRFNQGVNDLRASGELQKIIGKSYIEP